MGMSLLFAVMTAGLAPAASGQSGGSMRNCGLYSMYGVFQWFNADVELQTLINPKYLSSPDGSTLADLAQAANDHGLYGTPVSNLSLNSLRNSPYPIICSVRKKVTEAPYNHYVVVFPTDSGDRLAYDALDNANMPLNDLVTGRWNGYGLIVSPSPFSLWRLLWRDYLPYLLLFPGLLVVRAFLASICKSAPHAKAGAKARVISVLAGGLTLLATAVLAAVAADVWAPTRSMLSTEKSVHDIQERHLATFLERVDAEDVENAASSGALILDARRAGDYALGHIPSAINLNIWNDEKAYESVLKDMSPDRDIVVYCQSAGCPYAAEVSRRLWRRGYTNLKYYKAGWLDWHDARGGESEKQS